MNRRVIGAVGLTAAAVVGTGLPASAFWTLTSHPDSAASAKASTVTGAPFVQTTRTNSGNQRTITFKIVAPAGGSVPTTYRVTRVDLGTIICTINFPADSCSPTGNSNDIGGNKQFEIRAQVGASWFSDIATCHYKDGGSTGPDGPDTFQCTKLTTPFAAAAKSPSGDADLSKSGSESSPAKAEGASSPIPTPEPTPTPVTTSPTEPTPTPEPTPVPTAVPTPGPTPTPEPTPQPAVNEPAKEATPAEASTEGSTESTAG